MTSFVRRFRNEILAEWRRTARQLPAARGLSAIALVDHIPELLDEIAVIAEQIAAEKPPNSLCESARQHALERLGEGFDIETVVRELSALRGAALGVWARSHPDGSVLELRALDLAIDRAIATSAARYAESASDRYRRTALERERALGKLESLLAASPIPIAFVDRDLRYLRINDAMAALNGRPPADHLGRSVAEVLPDLADLVEPLLRRVLDTGEPVLNLELEVPSPARVHDAFALLVTFFPVRVADEIVGVGGVVVDVTDRKRARDALQAEKARIQAIIEHAPAAIWVKDLDGRIVLANHKLAVAIGRPFEELIGRRSADVLPPEFALEHESHDAIVAREQRAIEVVDVVPARDGTRTFLSIKFPIPGTPPLVGGIATEITQRKQIEADLRIAVRTREDVLAIVSHDLRNPLGSVQLGATMLMTQLGNDVRSRRHLEMIQRSCIRMENLIDDLLDSASIREGRLQLDLEPEPAATLLTEALDLQQPIADESGIAILRDGRLGDARVLCDRDRMLQVFGNLIGNALKFCRAGDTITVRGECEGDHALFSVADTGPGIQPALVAYLFDPYWSAAEHMKRGSGLGLYISRGIVEGHGGRIWVESIPGSGARFLFTIPLAPAAPAT